MRGRDPMYDYSQDEEPDGHMEYERDSEGFVVAIWVDDDEDEEDEDDEEGDDE